MCYFDIFRNKKLMPYLLDGYDGLARFATVDNFHYYRNETVNCYVKWSIWNSTQ